MKRLALAGIFAFAFYGTTNYYAGRRLLQWLQLVFNASPPLFWGVYIFCALTPFLAMLFSLSTSGRLAGVTGWIGRLGDQWMGVFLYLLLLTALADLVLWLGRISGLTASPMSDTVRFAVEFIVTFSVLGLCVYGNYHAGQLQHKSYSLQMETAAEGGTLKIALISDLHLGHTNGAAHVEKVVAQINRQSPDLVCIAGDVFNGSYHALRGSDETAELLRGIEAPYGVYACLGNHDAGGSYDEMAAFIEQSGVTLLNDEAVVIADRLILAGRKDISPIGGQGEARGELSPELDELPSGLPVVIMDHSPVNIAEYSEKNALILCGHTHRGQIFPFNLATKAMYTVDYGYYRGDPDGPQAVVTSGVATWGPPMRIGTDSEIVTVEVELEQIKT